MPPHRLTSATIETEAALRDLIGSPIEVVCAKVADRLTPRYGLGCKRPGVSNDYLRTFNRENVELVTDTIERVTPSRRLVLPTGACRGACSGTRFGKAFERVPIADSGSRQPRRRAGRLYPGARVLRVYVKRSSTGVGPRRAWVRLRTLIPGSRRPRILRRFRGRRHALGAYRVDAWRLKKYPPADDNAARRENAAPCEQESRCA